MFEWAQDANIIYASIVARSLGKKIKALVRFLILVIFSWKLKMTSLFAISEPDKHPRGYRGVG